MNLKGEKLFNIYIILETFVLNVLIFTLNFCNNAIEYPIGYLTLYSDRECIHIQLKLDHDRVRDRGMILV